MKNECDNEGCTLEFCSILKRGVGVRKSFSGKLPQLVFELTQQYWKTGILQKNHQVHINALIDVEQANVSEQVMAEGEEAAKTVE